MLNLNVRAARIGAALLTAALVGGCGMDAPANGPAKEPASTNGPAKELAPNSTLEANAEKADGAATEAELAAGLAIIQPMITERLEAYQPIAEQPDHRLLLHPGEGKRARLTIDVSSLNTLTLSPVIESLQGNDICMADPQAGVAGLHWQLDGGAVNDVVVDRTYKATIAINTANAKQLVLESSDQNGVIWCDWLAIGFTGVTKR